MTLASLAFLPIILNSPPVPQVNILQAVSFNVPVFFPVCPFSYCHIHQVADGQLETADPWTIGVLKASDEIIVTLSDSTTAHYLPVRSGQSDSFMSDNLPDMWVTLLEQDLREIIRFHIQE